MNFFVIDNYSEIGKKGVYLIHDNWNDWFEYEIAYNIYLKNNSSVKNLGRVKIAEKNQQKRIIELPRKFKKLDSKFFSIGFNDEYYENLKKTPYREQILKALNDIAFDLSIYEEVKQYDVTQTAVMREYTEPMLKGQIHRISEGGAKLTNYDFTYVFPDKGFITDQPIKMSFQVNRNEKPHSNIHVMIGKNGIGKTTIIKKMIYALEQCKPAEEVGNIELDSDSRISNIIFVSFSAFDEPIQKEEFGEEYPIDYKFVGLIGNKKIKNTKSLTEEFVECSFNFYKNQSKMRLWIESINILSSDNTFVEQQVDMWINDEQKNMWKEEINKNYIGYSGETKTEILKEKHRKNIEPKFSRLSSGHKIILLTLANLINLVEEKTLVLLDEPEEHLHPPLIAAFIKALSNLLVYRNGVAIVATHSPVIVQEVPKKCVWILFRSGKYLLPKRPAQETYGENLGELTREIFGYEVMRSGFYNELEIAREKKETYEEAIKIFDNQLGKEAKTILKAFMYEKGKIKND
mgnify:FL=1